MRLWILAATLAALALTGLAIYRHRHPAPPICDFTIDLDNAPCWAGTRACPIPCDSSN